MTFGGTSCLSSVPDRAGHFDDVVLGHDDAAGYFTNPRTSAPSSAATATESREAGSRWTARHYTLATNNGPTISTAA